MHRIYAPNQELFRILYFVFCVLYFCGYQQVSVLNAVLIVSIDTHVWLRCLSLVDDRIINRELQIRVDHVDQSSETWPDWRSNFEFMIQRWWMQRKCHLRITAYFFVLQNIYAYMQFFEQNWWMFHFTSEKGRIFEGIVYSWVKLKQVESHARVGLKSLSGGPKLSYVIRTTYEKHGQSWTFDAHREQTGAKKAYSTIDLWYSNFAMHCGPIKNFL